MELEVTSSAVIREAGERPYRSDVWYILATLMNCEARQRPAALLHLSRHKLNPHEFCL